MTEYFHQHQLLRRIMNQSQNPKMEKETSTGRFLENGLDEHPIYRDAVKAIKVTGLPETVSILEEGLILEALANQKFHALPTGTIPPRSGIASERPWNRRRRGRGESLRQKITQDRIEELHK